MLSASSLTQRATRKLLFIFAAARILSTTSSTTSSKDAPMLKPAHALIALALLLSATAGCKSAYYGVMEKFGREKRDILVSRVQSARDGQEAAKQQFKTTLQRFQEVTNFQGGELEARYKTLSAEYDRCERKANDVSTKIQKVETAASDMFKEWADENKQYTDDEKRRASEKMLSDTKTKYQQLIAL